MEEVRGGPGTTRARAVAIVVAFLAVALPGVALAAFPGANPAESPRINTPNDPKFDNCEGDDEAGPATCSIYGDEQYGAFGFSPDSANQVPLLPHSAAATTYVDCSQLDAQGQAVNTALGDPACAQISGVRADTAWKYSTGDPDTIVAVLDTGIEWQDSELVSKVHLNQGELPTPRNGAAACPYDCNGDGAVNVNDYANDPRVAITAGDEEADALLDASDLIATFSNHDDADGNGFVDDIAGWDFFDDDNDPFDASSCCSANGHGTDRARSAVGATNNGASETGMCPDCQLLPLRVWDTFVVPTDFFGFAALYATDNGASAIEGALGGLTNTQFARQVVSYADRHGVAMTLVSSDINSANHNYPTNYNEAIYVAGSIYDTAPNETCSGPGGLGPVDVPVSPPGDFSAGCSAFLSLLAQGGVNPWVGQPITTSFFRNSNLTQYGGKADIVLMGPTGSENTGQAAGVAGLLASFGRETFGDANPLSGNEIRQLMTMTAEDVLPANTGAIGLPDRANLGWDSHFGYGRVNMAAAMRRIANDRVPPEAMIDSPDWFSPLDVGRVGAAGVQVRGSGAAPHSAAGVGAWELEYACGQDATDSSFAPVPGGSGTGAFSGLIATLSKSLLDDLAANCDGSVSVDAGRPAGTQSEGWPANPFPNPDPERHAFQIRLTVHEAGDAANFGRYRKTLFAYPDDGNLAGWPKPIGSGSDSSRYRTGSGGEVPPRLYDLDGDNELDILLGTSSGELRALDSSGQPLASFNGGNPVETLPYSLAISHPPDPSLPVPHESLRAPAIGDIDGDREVEIVATAGEHVYAWERDGSPVDGFPARIVPSLSSPCIDGVASPCFVAAERRITHTNHIKRGFFAAPALADLDLDGDLEIVAASMDQHVYAYDGDGSILPGFPALLASAGADGAEIVNAPAIANLDGSGPPEIVVATNEVIPGNPQFPSSFFDFFGAVLGASTGSNPVYALHADGTPVSGWPVPIGVAAGDLLPLVLPGHDAAVLDVNGDGSDEVSLSAGTSVSAGGGVKLVNGDGSTSVSYENSGGLVTDTGPVLNLADYSAVGDISGLGQPSVVKGGLTVNGAANLLAVNQNLPFNHVVQAWDPTTGASIPGFPRATDDFQLVAQPAIARVGGSGTERQVLYGTGLYQMHAYGPGGTEPSGWPKFTGGWTQATPAVGDADGDGELDVSAVTREGWSFLWGTGVDACDDSNAEWWTFHHDEFNSNNYGTDSRPPATARNLALSRTPTGFNLSWVAPGDDWLCGSPAGYEIRVASDPIKSINDGTRLLSRNDGTASGGAVSEPLGNAAIGGAEFAAIFYRDEAGNWSLAASLPLDPALAACTILGSNAADTLIGTSGPDVICGRGGEDLLRGMRGDDVLLAGAGDDRLIGGPGADRLDGGEGRDLASFRRGAVNGAHADLGAATVADDGTGAVDRIVRVGGFSTIEDLRGTRFADVLAGDRRANRIYGDAGEDRLDGRGGPDELAGNRDDDELIGHGGADSLDGGDGADVLRAGGGADSLHGRRGVDRLYPGTGDDPTVDGDQGKNELRYDDIRAGGGINLDLVAGVVSGAAGDDRVDGLQFSRVFGTNGPDTLSARLDAVNRRTTLFGLGGHDFLRVDDGFGHDRVVGGRGGHDRCRADAGDRVHRCRAAD